MVDASRINLNGSGASLISASGGVSSSTLIGGAGADTINLTGSGFTTNLVTAGGDNDIIQIDGGTLNASIVGGAGNDSVDIIVAAANTSGSSTNTYFFGSGGGKDTIDFGTQTSAFSTGTIAFTIAVDSTYGATSGYSFTSSNGKLSFGNDSNFLTLTGITGSSANSPSALGITFTTVSTSVITDLG